MEAARLAADLGYTNILAFREGVPGWLKAGLPVESSLKLPDTAIEQISPQDLKARMDEVVLVDIRGQERSKIGVIPGTDVWLPLGDILEKYSEIPQGKTVVLYDTANKMTLVAGRFLTTHGYKVMRLNGGAAKWVGSGLPVEPAN